MWFSWAFSSAQETFRNVIARALPGTLFLEDLRPALELQHESSIALAYADNLCHMSLSRKWADLARETVQRELNRVGFPTHEVVEASVVFEMLGVRGTANLVESSPLQPGVSGCPKGLVV